MSELSLYNLSLWKTAVMLKQHYWNEFDDSNIGNNSFSYLPTSVVEDLLSCVLQITPIDSLKVSDIYHLVTSGRIKNFKLEDVVLTSEVLVSILMSLSVACQSLRSFILRNVVCSNIYTTLDSSKTYIRTAAVECVLNSASNLELVESCIAFDLKAVRNCSNLKILRLNFIPSTPLFNLLDEGDGDFCSNVSLKVLDVYEDVRHPVSSTDIAILLNYCRELTEINCDISQSLECLHTDEIYDGTLSRVYKLRKCVLGNTIMNPPFASASLLSVHIATLTCPSMEELDILVNDNNTVYALSDFLNLKSLLIQWEPVSGGEFKIGVEPLLEKIGENLKVLHVLNFFQVDFAAIGKSCPNLETLKVEYQTECSSVSGSSCSIFSNLRSLSIESMEGEYGVKESSLLLLLSNCKNLTTLCIQYAECLNDRVLREVLSKNPLSKVKDATILDCSLTGEGVRNLVNHLKMLEFFHFSSSAIIIEEAASIVHEINPHVIIRSDFD
ncbi:uncharacterized protein LOC129220243 [Uloborus diversus]|uniref:uncharacterized protein LOC129220243 n=1 Tax=Uloborus diversus TaxID=327109 RepID=UPI0024092EFC|nr:uncharacterized protein LOC129220243 [Uloborus diversus]